MAGPPPQTALPAETLDDLRMRWPGARSTRFGDSAALSDDLLSQIRAGRKTATCGSLAEYHAEDEPVPAVGDVLIALDHRDRPALAYRLTEVTQRPFREVTKDFARAEGAGSLADWHAAHRAFFEHNGGFSVDMPLVCERFRFVRVAGAGPLGGAGGRRRRAAGDARTIPPRPGDITDG